MSFIYIIDNITYLGNGNYKLVTIQQVISGDRQALPPMIIYKDIACSTSYYLDKKY